LTPVDSEFGLGRGRPVDRFYIERFLSENQSDIQGRVLEVGNNAYTTGLGKGRVSRSDVLNLLPGQPGTTVVADLGSSTANLPQSVFDCIILTQTLQFVFDLQTAVRNLHSMLKPGGVLLLTLPGISQISRYDMDRWGDYWRFTTRSTRQLLESQFSGDQLRVHASGNVLAAVAFLEGFAQEDLDSSDLEHIDADYELVITARAVRHEP
jgi:SAM-dependent methyltransferase